MIGVTEDRLKSIIHLLKVKIIKMGEKTVPRKSLIWTIIMTVGGDMSQEEKSELLMSLITVKKSADDLVPADIAHQALQVMPSDEVKADFEALSDRLNKLMMEERYKEEVTRKTGTKQAVERFTPECLKTLKPAYKGVILHLDLPKKSFEAYYPAGKPTRSTSMSWEGPRVEAAGRSKLSALMYCVEFLWRNHELKERVPQLNSKQLFHSIGKCLVSHGQKH